METGWPFFFLVENRATLLKVDVSAASGAVPTGRVTASWPNGTPQTLCLRAPASLPTSTDKRVQPATQDLTRSYALTLPAAWMRPGLALRMDLDGGASAQRTAAELKVASAPDLTLVVVPTLLFGDTQPRALGDAPAEFGSKLPVSTLRVVTMPFNLSLPRLVIAPRTDSPTLTGGVQSTPAQWANAKPHCSSADKKAGTCAPYSGFSVLDATLNLAAALQAANGMERTSLWYANHGMNSAVGGGLGGGNRGSGDDFGTVFNHEMGHAMGLPHLGDVTGARQTSATELMHPYTGETTRDDGQPQGGGFGRTWALDAQDFTPVSPVCAATNQEQQDPMQRGCNTVRTGRRYDHFSDAASAKLLRYLNGATATSGTVPYFSRLLPGTSADAPQATRYQLPAEQGRTQLRVSNGQWTLHRWAAATGTYEQLLRPPGGDTGFLSTPPAAPAGQRYDQYFDFRYPQQFDVPVITVFGTFNATSDATSTIYAAQATRGHLMRLWDPTQPAQLDAIKRSAAGETFWWGYDLHLRVRYRDGSLSYVAMPFEAKPTTDPMEGFTTWAVNLPDDGRAIDRIELLHRPLCSRNGAANDRSCDVNLASNGITSATVYNGARVAATWTPSATAASMTRASRSKR
jgi:Peptidase M66